MSPNYGFLQTFGYTCYLLLTLTAPHKLMPRSILCLFLGYDASHCEYCCLHVPTSRVYISYYVLFHETIFFGYIVAPPSSEPSLKFRLLSVSSMTVQISNMIIIWCILFFLTRECSLSLHLQLYYKLYNIQSIILFFLFHGIMISNVYSFDHSLYRK